MDNKVEEKEKKTYVSLYKKDGLSYSLTLSAIAVELVYVITILDVMEVSFWMGITVMVNIALLFLLFTCAVKMNVYEKRLAYAALACSIYMLVRQLILIPFVLKPYNKQAIIAGANLAGATFLGAAGYISIYRSSRRQKLQKKLGESGVDQKKR